MSAASVLPFFLPFLAMMRLLEQCGFYRKWGQDASDVGEKNGTQMMLISRLAADKKPYSNLHSSVSSACRVYSGHDICHFRPAAGCGNVSIETVGHSRLQPSRHTIPILER